MKYWTYGNFLFGIPWNRPNGIEPPPVRSIITKPCEQQHNYQYSVSLIVEMRKKEYPLPAKVGKRKKRRMDGSLD